MFSPKELEDKLGPIQIGLRSDLVISRHVLRERASYVVHDPVTFANHSFSVFEYRVLTTLVPERTLQETFASLVERQILKENEKGGFYQFILRLHGMNLLHLPITDAAKLFKRHKDKQRRKRGAPMKKLMYAKVPLFDPDEFLEKTLPYVGWAFSRIGLTLWLALISVAVWKCWGRFGEIFGNAGDLLQLSNMPILFVSLVVLKIIHEFGHAYACKRLGGAVPEMGLVFILATPCAFVDASASWKFPNPWHRIFVGMAGMYVEATVAAMFALIWAGTPPGFLHDVARNVLVLSSLVTVLFNINPLMRFDGYYVFSDLWGTANLWERAGLCVKSWAKSAILGLEQPNMDLSRNERVLYPVYGVSAVIYRGLPGAGHRRHGDDQLACGRRDPGPGLRLLQAGATTAAGSAVHAHGRRDRAGPRPRPDRSMVSAGPGGDRVLLVPCLLPRGGTRCPGAGALSGPEGTGRWLHPGLLAGHG